MLHPKLSYADSSYFQLLVMMYFYDTMLIGKVEMSFFQFVKTYVRTYVRTIMSIVKRKNVLGKEVSVPVSLSLD